MNISVILAHPNPKSFNHAIAETVVSTLRKNGHEVCSHDLYEESFNPVIAYDEIINRASSDLLIELHCREIQEADGIVIIHPNWWGQPPAILKGWVDRVLRSGTAYAFVEGDSGGGVPVGLLNAKKAIIFNTSDTPLDRELAIFGDPLETLWKTCILEYCGVREFERRTFGVMIDSGPEERRIWLEKVGEITKHHFPPLFLK